MDLEAILFDLDGVLIDSEPRWQEYWTREVFPRVERGTPTLDDVTGRNFREALSRLDDEYGLPDKRSVEESILSEAEQFYRNEESLVFSTDSLFETIQQEGMLVGIVSSSPRSWIDAAVSEYDTHFDIIVSVEDIDKPGKPNPAVYEHAMKNLDVEADGCIVVEDSDTGIEAAAAAGASVIRFQSYGDTEDHPEADAVARDKEALRDLIRRRLFVRQ